jgi:environmental stress-induced protein Ves
VTRVPAPGLIRGADLAITPWKNGAGRKADIASGPGWTVAYAWLDGDAAFSDYSGNDRTITLIEGPGFELLSPDGQVAVRVDAAFRPASFDGGAALHCRILGGVCRVVNVMTERRATLHSVEILGDADRHAAAPADQESVVLVILRAGITIHADGVTARMERFDALEVTGSLRLDGDPGWRAALFTIRPASRVAP